MQRGCWKPTFTELPQFLSIVTLRRNFSNILTSQQNPSLVTNTCFSFFPSIFLFHWLFYWWSRSWTPHLTVSSDCPPQSLRCATWSNEQNKGMFQLHQADRGLYVVLDTDTFQGWTQTAFVLVGEKNKYKGVMYILKWNLNLVLVLKFQGDSYYNPWKFEPWLPIVWWL